MSTMKLQKLRRGADPPESSVMVSIAPKRDALLEKEPVSSDFKETSATPGVPSRRPMDSGTPPAACDDNDSVGISSILDFLNRISSPKNLEKHHVQSTPLNQKSAPAVSPLSSAKESTSSSSSSSSSSVATSQPPLIYSTTTTTNPKLAAWTRLQLHQQLQQQVGGSNDDDDSNHDSISSSLEKKQQTAIVAAVSQSPLTDDDDAEEDDDGDGDSITTTAGGGDTHPSPTMIHRNKHASRDPPTTEPSGEASLLSRTQQQSTWPPPEDRPLVNDNNNNKVDPSSEQDLLAILKTESMQDISQRVKRVLWEAQQERESVRLWANRMRDSVQEWVRQQRLLVQCERTCTMDQTEELWKAKRQILLLQEAWELGRVDAETAAAERAIVETNLRALIQKQENEIRLLRQRILSLEREGVVDADASSCEERAAADNDETIPYATRDENVANSCDPPSGTGGTSSIKKPVSTSTPPQASSREMSSAMAIHDANNPGPSRGRRVLRDGNVVINYRNGAEKLIRKDGSTIVHYRNGDIKEEATDGSVSYFYAAAKTIHTRRPDGVEVYEYPNRQVERYYPNGKREITFPDGDVVRLSRDDEIGGVVPVER